MRDEYGNIGVGNGMTRETSGQARAQASVAMTPDDQKVGTMFCSFPEARFGLLKNLVPA